MSDLYWCPNCKANRLAKISYSKTLVLVLLILGLFLFITWVIAAIYLVYCVMEKKQCQVCRINADLMEPPRFGDMKPPEE